VPASRDSQSTASTIEFTTGTAVGGACGRTTRHKEKLSKLEEEVKRLKAIEKEMLAAPDQQISFTDPDSRSMATSGRGSGMVGYNVQAAVDTKNHLIVAHEVTNVGTDKSQLANMANQAKAALEAESLEAFADRGYFKGEEILACEEVGITVMLPKPQTSDAKSEGRFGKQDFRYLAEEDITFVLPARSSPTTSRTRKMDWSCAATGPMRAAPAR
jgi:hypothetical protein